MKSTFSTFKYIHILTGTGGVSDLIKVESSAENLIPVGQVRFAACLIHTQHDSFVGDITHPCGTGFILLSHIHSYVPGLIHMCHDAFTCGTTHLYVPQILDVCHDTFTCTMTFGEDFLVSNFSRPRVAKKSASRLGPPGE